MSDQIGAKDNGCFSAVVRRPSVELCLCTWIHHEGIKEGKLGIKSYLMCNADVLTRSLHWNESTKTLESKRAFGGPTRKSQLRRSGCARGNIAGLQWVQCLSILTPEGKTTARAAEPPTMRDLSYRHHQGTSMESRSSGTT